MKTKKPFFSIVVTTKNSGNSIGQTLKSIINQKYKSYEIILVDGSSTDETLDIVNRYKSKIKKIIMNSSNGPYVAMNLGSKYCQGFYITFLNSDDEFFDENVLKKIFNILNKNKNLCIYGNLIINKGKNIFRKWVSGGFKIEKVFNGWHPPHPGFFLLREKFKEINGFDTQYSISADIDMMLKLIIEKKIKPKYVNKFLINMQHGGISSKFLNIIKSNYECYNICKKYRIHALKFVLLKFFNKIKQIKSF